MPKEQFQRVQKKIELPQLQLAQEEMRSNIGRTARGRWKRPSKSEILPNKLLSKLSTEQTVPGASSTRFDRSSFPPRPSRHWRCRRKPSDANVRRSCRVKFSLTRRKPQDCDSVEQQSSAQDPEARSQPKLKDVTSKESFDKVKIRLSEINKHVSDGINKDHENQKGRGSSASPKLNW